MSSAAAPHQSEVWSSSAGWRSWRRFASSSGSAGSPSAAAFMVTRRNWAQRARYHRRGRRRQELKDEVTYTLQHLAWCLAAAGRELELVELALGLREDPF